MRLEYRGKNLFTAKRKNLAAKAPNLNLARVPWTDPLIQANQHACSLNLIHGGRRPLEMYAL